jgi:hypothetical protein
MLGALGLCALACACSFNTEGGGASASADDDGSSSSGAHDGATGPLATSVGSTLDGTMSGDGPSSTSPPSSSTTGDPSSDDSNTGEPTSTSGSDTGSRDGLLGEDALIVRYWLDEAASGALSEPIVDAGPEPAMHLQPSYSGLQNQPDYVEDDGNRGLRWTQHGGGGRGEIALAGTKLAALDGATSVTFEFVAEVTSVFETVEPFARLVVWQPDVEAYGIEMGILSSWEAGDFALDFRASWDPGGGLPIARWSLAGHPGRVVGHLVVDTTDPPAGFLRMFLDGQEIEAVFNDEGPPGVGIDVGDESFLVLGNRPNDNGSFGGTIYYLAIYGRPLDEAEIAHNAAQLSADDDAP